MAKILTLRLPDGSIKEVPTDSRPRDVAESIGRRLAQAAIAAKVNGQVVDLHREFSSIPLTPPSPPGGEGEGTRGDAVSFQILTEKDRDSLDVLRQSRADGMARAVKRLFPRLQL